MLNLFFLISMQPLRPTRQHTYKANFGIEGLMFGVLISRMVC